MLEIERRQEQFIKNVQDKTIIENEQELESGEILDPQKETKFTHAKDDSIDQDEIMKAIEDEVESK